MNIGRTVFSQLMAYLPDADFDRCVSRYRGDRNQRGFSCRDQFLAMAFAQITYRESLRDIEACLGSMPSRLYHMGFRGKVSRSTLADANDRHDWRIYLDLAKVLTAIARPLYAGEPIGIEIDQLYAIDSTTIDLCLSLFPWAKFRSTKAAIKLHTVLDLHGNIPEFLSVSNGNVHDVNFLDDIVPQAGAFYVMDRGYLDFSRLNEFHLAGAFYVTRNKSNVALKRRYSSPSSPVHKDLGVRSDQTVVLASAASAKVYPHALRRVVFVDPESIKRLEFLTNNFQLAATDIAKLYKLRWQIELFFKWIKQHLRIKAFFGTSDNAVKTQIWIAISVYLLAAIARKRLALDASLYQILQILSVTVFEKTSISRALERSGSHLDLAAPAKQLILFDE